jgi:hypothetical protein
MTRRAAQEYGAGYGIFNGYEDCGDYDDYDDYDDYYDTNCNGHDYCGCKVCHIHPNREPCSCSYCQLNRKLPTYCHQCSFNIERLVAKYTNKDTKYQKILKSVDFPRAMRSNEKCLIKCIKYLLQIVDNYGGIDISLFVNSDDMTKYCEVLCPKCQAFYREHSDVDAIRNRLSRMVKSNLVSKMFNLLISKKILPYYQTLIHKSHLSNQRLFKVNKKKIRHFAKENEDPISHLWKGSNHYHKKIFGIPCILEDTGVSIENFQMRETVYLNDSICGHSMASDGWFQESLKDTIELYQEYGIEFELY